VTRVAKTEGWKEFAFVCCISRETEQGMADIVEQAEQLHAEKKFLEIFDLLSKAHQADPNNVEIGWRFCRAHYDAAEAVESKEAKKDYITKGFALVRKYLETNPEDPLINKWVAILTSGVGEFVSQKEKIGNAYVIKEHALKALEKRPDDASLNHILGRWCYSIANISWLERTAASALFATPPTSSFEEALGFLQKADALLPNFLRNAIAIGDTYVGLKQKDKAREWYQKAAEMPYKGEKETQMHNEAAEKAKSI